MNTVKLSIEELVELYNPTNARALTPEQIQAMQSLTDDEIAALAKAYPNQARSNNYLVLIDTAVAMNKQTYQLNTWQNLNSLRKLGKKNFSAFTFYVLFKNIPAQPIHAGNTAQVKKPALVVDLTNQELRKAEGFKQEDEGGNVKVDVPAELKTAEVAAEVKTDDTVIDSPELTAAKKDVETITSELEAAKAESAHHMTIKSIQARLDAANQKVTELSV